MLKVDDLKSQIKTGIQNIVIPAIERIELMKQPVTSELGTEQAKNVADTFDELISEPLAEVIANAIDYYVKNIAITGTIITIGGPTTQTAQITSMPTPVTNGKVPNTLGIS